MELAYIFDGIWFITLMYTIIIVVGGILPPILEMDTYGYESRGYIENYRLMRSNLTFKCNPKLSKFGNLFELVFMYGFKVCASFWFMIFSIVGKILGFIFYSANKTGCD